MSYLFKQIYAMASDEAPMVTPKATPKTTTIAIPVGELHSFVRSSHGPFTAEAAKQKKIMNVYIMECHKSKLKMLKSVCHVL